MENENYNTIIKVSIGCFKYSLIVGTLIYVGGIITRNEDFFFGGFFYLILALIINLIMLLTLLVTLITFPENRLKSIKAIGILLLNIPIATFYFYTLFGLNL